MATVYLGLGANLGDRLKNLKDALTLLANRMCIEQVSSVYETQPQGYTAQPMFLNAAVRATTALPAEKLLKYIKSIEKKMGRVPSFRNAPRPVDIDILFYDRQTINIKELTVPHPRMKERSFVLVPLAEIAPDMADPESGLTVQELKQQLGKVSGIAKWGGGDTLFIQEQRCTT